MQLGGGALPVSLSDTVRALKARMLLDSAIAVAPCVDGDLQCATAAGALTHAAARGAEVIVCGIGPGIVGTGSRWGHGGLAVADAANVASALGGLPIVAPRVSLGDTRPPAPRPVAPHALGARAVPRQRPGGVASRARPAIRRRRGRGRRHRLGSRVRAPATRPHGARAGRGSLVLRRLVRRREARGRVMPPVRNGALSSRAPCGSASRKRSSRRSTASR